MTVSTQSVTRLRDRPAVRFTLHFVEMIVAMVVGMMLLGPLWTLVPGLPTGGFVPPVLMVVDMTVGMGLWMRVRGHSWASTGEMCAAMAAPFAVLLVPYAAGAVSADLLMVAGHVLMVPAMLLAMLRRRHEYAGHRH